MPEVIDWEAARAERVIAREAIRWVRVLSLTFVSLDDLYGFFEWRRVPAHREAYAKASARLP